jgi:hypothetical protein
VDWDNDGKLDILSGCYWTEDADSGHMQILRGVDKLNFEESTALLSVAGTPLENFERKEDGDAPKSMDEDQKKNICIEQHAVDYDGDGDLDLIVGCFSNKFFLYENIGSSEENKLVEKPIEMNLVSPDNHASPHLVDFDGDGDLDFLTGGVSGGAYIAVNDGTKQKPSYGKFKTLLEKCESPDGAQRLESLTVGRSTRVWATDFNSDGLMDLLVGDMVIVSQPAKGIAEAEYRIKKAEHRKKMARMVTRMQILLQAGRKMAPEAQETFFELFREHEESIKRFEDSKSTGFVWLLIQKSQSETGTVVTLN